MFHEQQQTILMWSNVREWTHILLVNTPFLHLHSFCATGMSSGIATRVTSTQVSGEVGIVYYTGVDLCLTWFSYRNMWLLLLDSILNGTPYTTSYSCIKPETNIVFLHLHYYINKSNGFCHNHAKVSSIS
jgi:hypothetical protein